MKTHIILLVAISLIALSGCEEIFMHPEPGTDNLSIFDEYAKICSEKFALEEVKGIDIDVLADSIRPFITDELNEEELFNYLGIITNRLEEGHTKLSILNTRTSTGYDHFMGYPNADGFAKTQYYYGEDVNPTTKYIGTANYETFRLAYGRLPQDTTIGFISVISFDITLSDEELETMFKDLSGTKGLVLDIRTNLGGYIAQVSKLASYFTNEAFIWGENNIKNGPGPNDFAMSPMKLSPSGSEYTYTNPVMLLHNRVTFSSGSLFAIMMYSMPHVTTIGQIFGGGTGEIIYGFLANGWKYSLSTANLVDKFGRPTDNGIEPDIPHLIDAEDTEHDALIDRAIEEIQKR